jgi:HAD superfamily hydrolase (TIGR01549 family)
MWQAFSTADTFQLYHETRSVLNQVKHHHPSVVLGVATNMDARILTILRNLDLHHYFQFVVHAETYNCKKPDLLRRAFAPYDIGQVLHVGDDKENNYNAARALGAQALRLNRRGPRDQVDATLDGVLVRL